MSGPSLHTQGPRKVHEFITTGKRWIGKGATAPKTLVMGFHHQDRKLVQASVVAGPP